MKTLFLLIVSAVVGGNLDTYLVPTEITPVISVETLTQELLPSEYSARIVAYYIESDGPDGTLAVVESVSADGSKWQLGYDPVDSFYPDGALKPEFIATLIHEYAHIISLNETQVRHTDAAETWVACAPGETILDEGCALIGSYLDTFTDQFWEMADIEAAYNASLEGEEAEEDFADVHYNARPYAFVSEYAATNEVEDFAESFMWFVEDTIASSTESVADQKQFFFYQYPELVSLRRHIRTQLSNL